ncbi:MAG TPA: acyl-CoA carboxylase subunit beta [Dehalococcoidia bacterium]|nr:acyl-CoA carboxylase subunit beta [Dehalococcoidia bacterium]
MENEMEQKIQKLREVKERLAQGGGAEKIARQHQQGKLTARERIDRLLDPGSFVELNRFVGHEIGAPGDGIVTGYGTIDGRQVCIYSQDATVLGGSVGPYHGYLMYRTTERALEMGVPAIGLLDSPGARAMKMGHPAAFDAARHGEEKSVHSVYMPITQASGVIPQISAILGSCAGVSVYAPALTDFIFMVDGISHMFITGPRVIESVLSEEISKEDLGGARVHTQISGVADFRDKSEDACFKRIRKLLSFLPSNNREPPPVVDTGDDPERLDDTIADIVPTTPYLSYDMHQVIARLVDNGDFFEVKREFAAEVIVGFGRLEGHTVGFIANQPMIMAGALTYHSSDKQARFIRFCDCFNIPIVILVDTPAYMPGSDQEHAGIIRHGAKVLYSWCEAVVPRIAVLLRKGYGGGMIGMGVMAGMGTDLVFAWPSAEIGVLGPEQSVDLFYAEEISKAEDPEAYRAQKVKEYRDFYANPISVASQATYIHDIIEPRETRRRLISALRLLRNKQVSKYPKRHGNIPL